MPRLICAASTINKPSDDMTEKLQKVLARAGFGSRREIEGWIAKGRIKVNGKIAIIGERVSDTDKIGGPGQEPCAAPGHPLQQA